MGSSARSHGEYNEDERKLIGLSVRDHRTAQRLDLALTHSKLNDCPADGGRGVHGKTTLFTSNIMTKDSF